MNGPALWRLLMLVIVLGLFVLFTGRFGLHPFLVFVSLTVVFGAAVPTSGFFDAMDDGVRMWFREVGPTILLSVITVTFLSRSGALTALTRRLFCLFGHKHGIFVACFFSLLAFLVEPNTMLLLFGPVTINYSITCKENPSGPLLAVALSVISVSSSVAPSLGPMKAIEILEAPMWASVAFGLPVALVQVCLAWLWSFFIAKRFHIRLPTDEVEGEEDGESDTNRSADEFELKEISKNSREENPEIREQQDRGRTHRSSGSAKRTPYTAKTRSRRQVHSDNEIFLETTRLDVMTSRERVRRSSSSKIYIHPLNMKEVREVRRKTKHARSYSHGDEPHTIPAKSSRRPSASESSSGTQKMRHQRHPRKLNTSDPGSPRPTKAAPSSGPSPVFPSVNSSVPSSVSQRTTPVAVNEEESTVVHLEGRSNIGDLPQSKFSCAPREEEEESSSESYDMELGPLGSIGSVPSLFLSPNHNAWFIASPSSRKSPPSLWLALATVIVPVLMMLVGSVFRGLAFLVGPTVSSFMEIFGNTMISLPVAALLSFTLPEIKTRRMVSMDGELGLALKMACTLAFTSASGSILAAVARNTMDFREIVQVLPRDAGVFAPFLVAFVEKFFMGLPMAESMAHSAHTVANTLPRWDIDSDIKRALASVAIGAGALTASHVTDCFFWIVAELTRYDLLRMIIVYKLGTFMIGIVTCLIVWLLATVLWAGISVIIAIISITIVFMICVNCFSEQGSPGGVCNFFRRQA
eukprot:TRINITY_DN14388_c0_g1_i1.p1 TRINITY_DN14388_c0_g1~~TRINITY_DN14388_c0_g1_i1.p1  ORF type:complete len:760 (+),score=89.24 TRINITY_DN14388_c0_g1_i1:32-2281(+)